MSGDTTISLFLGDGKASKSKERLSVLAHCPRWCRLGACWEVRGWLERLGISPCLPVPCISLCFPVCAFRKGSGSGPQCSEKLIQCLRSVGMHFPATGPAQPSMEVTTPAWSPLQHGDQALPRLPAEALGQLYVMEKKATFICRQSNSCYPFVLPWIQQRSNNFIQD